MKRLLFLAFILGFLGADAQTASYSAYLRFGRMNVDDSRYVLPSVITKVQNFNKKYYGVGGEIELILNRLVLDGEISVLSHGVTSNGTYYADPFEGAILGKTGIVVFKSKNILAYPSFGAGVNGIFINTYTKTDGVKNNLHTIYLLTPSIDVGANADFILYRFRNEPTTGMLPVGIRGGFRFTTQSDKWKRISGTQMTKQLFANGGWYLSVAVGIGYIFQ